MENNADVKPQNNTRKTLTIVLISLLAAALVLGGVLIALKIKADREEEQRQSIINSGTFHAGITVGGVDVSGMGMDAAKDALKAAEEKLTEDVGFTVTDGEHTYTIDKSFFNITYNTEEKLNEAMALGREGTLEELQAELGDIAANGRSFDIEYTIAAPDFTEFAAGIAAEPYEGGGAPQEGYALMTGEGEAIWNAGSGVYRVTLNGDIAEQLKELCE